MLPTDQYAALLQSGLHPSQLHHFYQGGVAGFSAHDLNAVQQQMIPAYRPQKYNHVSIAYMIKDRREN